MKSSIIKIGNSNGLILPAEILKSLNLGLKSLVTITSENDSIVIKPAARSGWAHAAVACHESGEDKLLIPETFEEDKFVGEEWTW